MSRNVQNQLPELLLVWAALLAVVPQAVALDARRLTFEERVRAQEAIERVYYSHVIGTDRRFEDAVPRSVLEKKVRSYLRKSVALQELWNTPVSSDALRAEFERIAHRTRFPERLEEIYAALGRDAFLLQECFARPFLVDRLALNFFQDDERLHGSARREADELQRSLLNGLLRPFDPHARRTELSVRRIGEEGSAGEGAERRAPTSPGFDLDPDAYQEWRARSPSRVGEIGPVVEEAEAYVIRVILAEGRDRARAAIYAVPKVSWETWWSGAEDRFDERRAEAVATAQGALPPPGGLDPDRVEGEAGVASAACAPDDTWQNGSLDDVPDGRSSHTAIWTGSTMIVWGGFRIGGAVDTGGRYDPLSDTWAPTSTMNAPAPRYFHSAVWTGSLMIVWGGQDYSWFLGTGGRYDPATDTWQPTSMEGAPTLRQRHTAVWTGSLMVIWGGYDARYLNTGGRYDPVGDTWTPTSTLNAPEPREIHTAVWTGTSMIVWGGDNDGPDPVLVTGGQYDPGNDSWYPTSTVNAPAARYHHTAVWTGSRMLVWGGYVKGAYTNTGGQYDLASDTWMPMSTAGAPTPRLEHSAVWAGSRMIVWGGWNPNVPVGSTGGRYDPGNDMWEDTSAINAPSVRSSHTAVWSGSLMIVWGGGLRDSTGGRYDPASDTWTPTSTANAPSARVSPGAIWTGSHLIVWGGYDAIARLALSTGGKYDPVSDTWLPTSSTGAPAARQGHTVVWTGSQMIVWGGTDGTALGTGGRYDPLTDTWLPTSITAAPAGRLEHTAIWSGSRMIVWGGTTSGYLNTLYTGGRYDPVTDSWTPTSLTNAPAARRRHVAIWTGRAMVVWGGSSDTYPSVGGVYDPIRDAWSPTSPFFLGTDYASAVWTGSHMIVWGGSQFYGGEYFGFGGGRYDPTADSWTYLSDTGAPSARGQHTAVWTGRYMVVWGGRYSDQFSTTFFNTGGRYDPVSDSWTPTSTIGAPVNRAYHAAVWTGRRMIVWGGHPYLGGGGQYAVGAPLDADGDGFRGCDGDCDDGDAARHPGAAEVCNGIDDDCDGVVDLVPSPLGVPALGLAFSGSDAFLAWTPLSDAAGYDIVGGDLGALRSGGGNFAAAIRACLADDLGATDLGITDSPATGEGVFYLVRGVNCGGPGTYDSGASSQIGPRDAGVNASPVSCP